jgi:hypothetical protein
MYGRTAGRPRTQAIVQVGFNGNPQLAVLELTVPDLSNRPSRIAASKLEHAIEAKKASMEVLSHDDTAIARLVHARLYGNEIPYATAGIDTLVKGYNKVKENFREDDDYFFFESRAAKFNLSVYNRSENVLEDASLVVNFPRIKEFKVAKQMFHPPGQEKSKHELDLLGYPQVQYFRQAVRVTQKLGDVMPKTPGDVFETELRLACTPQLAGKKIALAYIVNARNLEEPQQGRLKLVFVS